MTGRWLLIWLIADLIGDRGPLLVDPLNWWTATLILAVALDLGRQHAPELVKREPRDSRPAGCLRMVVAGIHPRETTASRGDSIVLVDMTRTL